MNEYEQYGRNIFRFIILFFIVFGIIIIIFPDLGYSIFNFLYDFIIEDFVIRDLLN